MTRTSRFVLGFVVLLAACTDTEPSPMENTADVSSAGGGVKVTTTADAGPGSFRQAVLDAGVDPSIGSIRVEPGLGTIKLLAPLTYSGAQPLIIHGAGSRLDASGLSAGESALIADGGGDLTIAHLTVVRSPGNGITIKVPGDASGRFTVRLRDVVIRENGLHGILVNDQSEYFTDPLSTSEAGSPASLLVDVADSRFEKNGFALIDSDGLRVNEGGDGTLEAHIRRTRFSGNGADGLELDERAAGDAKFSLSDTELISNGAFSSEDLDDGIDVDEGADGDLVGHFTRVVASRNFEQGVDLNENGMGNLLMRMTDVRAFDNNEEGIEFEEDDDVAGGGDIDARLVRITTGGNGRAGGDAGIKLREKGEGDLVATLVEAVSVANRTTGGGDPIAGILLREDEGGDLTANLVQATARRNSGDGIQLEENEDGSLTGRIRRSTVSANDGAGANLAQEAPGAGEVVFTAFTARSNGGGPLTTEGVTASSTP